MFENLIRSNPDSVLVCDKESLKFLEVNDNACNLYGYRREEFLQLDLTDLYYPEDIQLLLGSSINHMNEGTFSGPYKHKSKNGNPVLVEIARYSVKFKEREAHFNVVRSISERFENEKKNKIHKAVFDNTDNLVFITDSLGFIQFINLEVTKVLGFTKSELLTASFTSIVADEERSKVNQSIFQNRDTELSSLGIKLKQISGQILDFNITAIPIKNLNEEIEIFTLTAKAVNKESRAEGKTSSVISNSESIDILKNQIDSKFLGGLFHELLTPINVILGYAQEIGESIVNPTLEQTEASKIIKQNRAVLLQSMNSAIEYSSLIETHRNVLLTETKITDIIDHLVNEIKQSTSSEGVELAYGKISSSLRFETDQQRFKYLMVLLFNLIISSSDNKKLYFSAYAYDKDSFLITFRNLQTFSSKSLVSDLNEFCKGNIKLLREKYGISNVQMNLTQLLLDNLKGKFIVLNESPDKSDYAFLFPIKHGGFQIEDLADNEVISKGKLNSVTENLTSTEMDYKGSQSLESDKNPKPFQSKDKEEAIKLETQNELRMEMLKEKIRKREHEKKQGQGKQTDLKSTSTDGKDEEENSNIEFFDVDINKEIAESGEEEIIEIIETSAPQKEIVELTEATVSDEKVDISRLSCLYFEDHIDSQVLFRFQMKGIKSLNFAVSFEESLPLLESGNYDFIVIDINLQGSYNGLDILRILRTMPKYENTPVFAVTAYMLPGDQQKFVLAGFNGFISKPIFRDQMIDVLAEVFNPAKQS